MFIKLTTFGSGKVIYIRPKDIMNFGEGQDYDLRYINCYGEICYNVIESIEEIIKRIQEAGHE